MNDSPEPKKRGPLLDDWAKLHIAWHTDDVLRAAAHIEPACLVMWPILVAMSKAQSHVETNPHGVIGISLGDLAGLAMVDPEAAHRALDTFVDGEMISYAIGRLQTLRISVLNFGKWQTPRKSKAQRNERHHESRAGILPSLSVTSQSPVSHTSGDCKAIDGDGEETKTETKKTVAKIRKAKKSKPLARVTDPELDARVTACFAWYCDLFDKTGQNALSLTQKRYDAIAWALTEFSGEQIAECLRGFHSDPWRLDGLGRHDIHKLLRDKEQVETGIDLSIGAANRGAAATPELVATGELVRIERIIGRDLTSDEESALQAGTVTPDAFLIEAGAA